VHLVVRFVVQQIHNTRIEVSDVWALVRITRGVFRDVKRGQVYIFYVRPAKRPVFLMIIKAARLAFARAERSLCFTADVSFFFFPRYL